MSQFFTSINSGNLPPAVPTSFKTDKTDTTTLIAPASAGTVIPQANSLQVTGLNGIQTYQPTNVAGLLEIGYNSGKITTVDATPTTILTITPPNNSGQTYQFLFSAYDSANGICFGGQLLGVARTVSNVVTVLLKPDKFTDKDGALAMADFNMMASGANIIIQVTGVAGHTIDWVVINAAGVVTAT